MGWPSSEDPYSTCTFGGVTCLGTSSQATAPHLSTTEGPEGSSGPALPAARIPPFHPILIPLQGCGTRWQRGPRDPRTYADFVLNSTTPTPEPSPPTAAQVMPLPCPKAPGPPPPSTPPTPAFQVPSYLLSGIQADPLPGTLFPQLMPS